MEPAVPTSAQYMTALQKVVDLTESHIRMLRIHFHSPERKVTATQLANAMGYKHYSIANSQYGRLGRLVGEPLDYHPVTERVGTLVTFEKRNGEWHWLMRPQLAEALDRLGWVGGSDVLMPEEIAAVTSLVEGAVSRVSVNAYERNPVARRLCLAHHGQVCCICAFNFGKVYGEIAVGFIHVHHLRSLSEIGCEYEVDPIVDLRPVCPNCHAVLHRRLPSYSIEEVVAMLRQTNTMSP